MQFQVMGKPSGASCNLRCAYCFYLEKSRLYKERTSCQMSSEVLEAYIQQYIDHHDTGDIYFAWQGGEPTLLGINYFRQVLSLQQQYSGDRKIHNSIQTNGTLIDDEWGRFFGENKFLVGISIDGPGDIHDHYRKGGAGDPTFDKVMAATRVFKKYDVAFNTLTVLNNINAEHPIELYLFLKEIGDGHMQFIPAVERQPGEESQSLGLDLAIPPGGGSQVGSAGLPLTSWSVSPQQLAGFYITLFDHWLHNDVGEVFVQFFDVTLGNYLGASSGLCHFQERCGLAGALEHNGDLYSCDHYVYPECRLGNILETPMALLMKSKQQKQFGRNKQELLPGCCSECDVQQLCNGDCPKHRFVPTVEQEPGVSYLCEAYKRIFRHMSPYLKLMAELIDSGRPASQVKQILQQQRGGEGSSGGGRNLPCGCGSGKKFKRCCGRA